ncbi:MAG: SpoIIE family protein phosphatase [Spirochaetota bacterium]
MVIVVAYLVTAAATVGAFWWSVTGTAMGYIRRYSVSQNELEKNRLLSIINRELALSLKMMDDPVIKDWMRGETDPARSAAAMKELESYRRIFRDGTWFVAVGSTRHYYAQTPTTAGIERTVLRVDNPGDRWFFESLERKQNYWINVNYDALLDEVRVWINALVKDDSGATLGLAGEGMSLGGFLLSLVDHAEPGISTIVVDSGGDILAYRDHAVIDHNARATRDADKIDVFQLLESDADRQGLRAAMEKSKARGGRTVETVPLGYEGRTVLAAIGYIPELDWHNLVLVDGSRIIGLSSFVPIVLVFLLSLLLVLSLVVFLMNTLVLAPLGRLNEAAGTLAGGSYGIRIPIVREDEIGALSASFNLMVAKVRDYTLNLEGSVAERTRELAEANRALTETQGRLLDSIQYGRLIQNSILPAAADLETHLGDFFLLQRPLDTVGGDFCFFRPLPAGFCVAVIDCTGHGVPGAFMTMMVNALLGQILETRSGAGPASMLERLDRLVLATLRSETETAHLHNGLDIALCVVDAGARTLAFAGAGLPLFVSEGGTLREVRGSPTHLGFSGPKGKKPITERLLAMAPGARYYLLTDGVLDLPGGERGFGFGRRGVLDLLGSLSGHSLEAQAGIIEEALDRHRGMAGPIDDLLLFGFSLEGKKGSLNA